MSETKQANGKDNGFPRICCHFPTSVCLFCKQLKIEFKTKTGISIKVYRKVSKKGEGR